jgi:hypothetical protein
LVEWIKREKDELDQLKESLLNESPSLSYEDHKRLIEVESLFLEAAAAGHKARASAVYLQTLSE